MLLIINIQKIYIFIFQCLLIKKLFQWMYILPLVIFMMIAGASNPEARQ